MRTISGMTIRRRINVNGMPIALPASILILTVDLIFFAIFLLVVITGETPSHIFCRRAYAAANELAATAGSAAEIAADEDFWGPIQRAFTMDRGIINLNNGGVSPSPLVVQEAHKRHLDFSNSTPPPRPSAPPSRTRRAADMASFTALAAATTVGNPKLNITIFVIFVLVTLTIVIKVAGGKKTAEQYYTAGGAFSGRQNGIAIAGDYLSAASFLGIAGAIALSGMDGFLYSIGFLVAWLVALLLVAELMRNTGRFTMADVLAYRLKQRPIRIAVSVSVLCVSLFYLLAQMAGAGALVALLLGVTGNTAQNLVIAVVGAVMVTYVLIGGMKGTTWVQIIKAILLISAAAIMTVWVLGKAGGSLSGLFGDAITKSAESQTTAKAVAAAAKAGTTTTPDAVAGSLLHYGAKYGKTTTSKIDFISLSMALVLGTAGLPHVLQRFYTVPTSKQARKSVEWAIWLIGGFYLLTLIIGFGAGALVGERGVHRPVAHHMAARREGRADELGEVLGPIGGDQQRLGGVVEVAVGRVGHDLSDHPPDPGAAVLPGHDRVEGGAEPGCMRGLTAALGPLEGDVAAGDDRHEERNLPSAAHWCGAPRRPRRHPRARRRPSRPARSGVGRDRPVRPRAPRR